MKIRILKYNRQLIIVSIFGLWLHACKKADFLNAKPNSNLTVPNSLEDFQALMDNYNLINQSPALGDMSSDNYFMSDKDYLAQYFLFQNCYLWKKDLFAGNGNLTDWNLPYQQVFVANVVLDGLAKLNQDIIDTKMYKQIKGAAYFIRGNAFYNLAQLFAPCYDSITAEKDLGLPLPLHADVTKLEKRATVAKSHDQIIDDLNNAAKLLQNEIPTSNINRPIKPAAFTLLSRTYLSIRAYKQSGAYADSALKLYNTLIDYNSLNASANLPFTRTNLETMMQNYQIGLYNLNGAGGIAQIDTILYKSYENNDLRKQIFYRTLSNGYKVLKGTYSGNYSLFSGFATNELFLNRAEAFARMGDIANAMKDLNTLLVKRYVTGTFVPLTAATAKEALDLVLQERRKELPFSSVRWSDLRRLNKEGYNIIPKRIINGMEYILTPNSPLYVLPIPPDEIGLSGIEQNPR